MKFKGSTLIESLIALVVIGIVLTVCSSLYLSLSAQVFEPNNHPSSTLLTTDSGSIPSSSIQIVAIERELDDSLVTFHTVSPIQP